MRVRGLEALRKWIGEDEGILGIIRDSGLLEKWVCILRSRTVEGKRRSDEKSGGGNGNSEGMSAAVSSSSSSLTHLSGNGRMEGELEEEEGVSVFEKNGILGIVLEVIEGGGWMGEYAELEEVVSILEEEGEKEWRERKRKKEVGGNEWKEMGRLAHDVAWGIEKRKKMEEGGDEEYGILSVGKMKKELEEEKKKAKEENRLKEEEKRMKEEERKKREESERGREEERKKREAVEREKKELEERLNRMSVEMEEQKKREEEEEKKHQPITSLDAFCQYHVIHYSDASMFTRSNNTITHTGHSRDQTIILGRAQNFV